VSPSFGEEIAPGQRKWHNYVEPDPKFAKEINKKIMELVSPFLKSDDSTSEVPF
jgi:hypothetical protein